MVSLYTLRSDGKVVSRSGKVVKVVAKIGWDREHCVCVSPAVGGETDRHVEEESAAHFQSGSICVTAVIKAVSLGGRLYKT